MNENEISYAIRGAIFNEYNHLGPGLLESVYVMALHYELEQAGCTVEIQVPLPVWYNGIKLDGGYRIDILVNNMVIIEVKSVETLADVHHKQLLTYLKLSNKRLGILVNFNSSNIKDSVYRKVNNLIEVSK